MNELYRYQNARYNDKKTHFPIDAFRILVGGECREIARNVLVFLVQFSASCLCELRVSSLTNNKRKAEGGGGVNQTRLRHDIDEVINKRQEARVSH